MVMEMLGPCLEDLFKYCKRKFTIKTTCMLAEAMINRMETMHTAEYIHRDIKPDNFLIGAGRTQNTVYVIDFGLSKRYNDPKTGLHIKYDDTKSLTGTARYASTNAHRGIEQSRRDDLESVGMVLVYFLRGYLPWQGLAGENKKLKYERIKEKKINTSMKELCEGLPPQVLKYLEYVTSLKFDKAPNYDLCRKFWRELMVSRGHEQDIYFDWLNKKMQKQINPRDYADYKEKERQDLP